MTTWTNSTEGPDNWDAQAKGSYVGRTYVVVGYVDEETSNDTSWTNATEATPTWTNQ